MNFAFNSYFLKINEFENEKFYEEMERTEVEIPRALVDFLGDMEIDLEKPSYYKEKSKAIYIKYHICGEIISFDSPRSACADPNTIYADGLHPIYKLPDDERVSIYFTENVEMREPFLNDMAFEMNITVELA
jgi:hypothetical protein